MIKKGLKISKKDPVDLYYEYHKEIDDRRKKEIWDNFKMFDEYVKQPYCRKY